MARKPPTPVRTTANLTSEQMRRGIERLGKRIQDLEAFDVNQLESRWAPEVQALNTSIADTLDKVFGTETVERKRFDVGSLDRGPLNMGFFPGRSHEPPFQPGIREGVAHAIATLKGAIRSLEEELEEQDHQGPNRVEEPLAPRELNRRVFIVHGRDEGPREAVARYLERIGFEPIILHEQANKGMTVIEKVEAYGAVDFAVVLLTPDDEGNLKGEAPRLRARQNVLLELGYFLGRLGRKHVCTLVSGEIEIPSDWAGVVSERFDGGGGWKQVLARELVGAGHSVDWNRVMT